MKTDKDWAGDSFIDEIRKAGGITAYVRASQDDARRHAFNEAIAIVQRQHFQETCIAAILAARDKKP